MFEGEIFKEWLKIGCLSAVEVKLGKCLKCLKKLSGVKIRFESIKCKIWKKLNGIKIKL